MRIVVMGAGGQGGFYASKLIEAGHELYLIARGKHLKAMQTKGLIVKSKQLGETHHTVIATDNPETLDLVDLILFCVKNYDLQEAVEQIKPLIQEKTIILPIQNGVEAPDKIGEKVGLNHVLGGVSYVTAHIEEPGTIVHQRSLNLIIGELDGIMSSRVKHLESMFKDAGFDIVLSDNIRLLMWQKYVWQTGLIGVLCLTRLPFKVISGNEVSWEFTRKVMLETRSVGLAMGFDVSVEYIDGMLNRFQKLWVPGTKPSMLVDLEAGRRIELEAYNGAVVRLGKKQGIETPLNYAIYAALKPSTNGTPKE